ncbi:uncharacterized protein [Tenebrio molitor]|uniref:uncharacterized protein isoform X1 n=1 Tax=Tenebrio molitor TaxID=7067 RepID=UPI003624780F
MNREMRIVNVYSILLISYNVLCRDAIRFFITHKRVKHAFIEVLQNKDNSSKNWIEYRYIFETDGNETQKVNGTLKVGIFIGNEEKFNCHVSNEKKNQTLFGGYNIDVIKILDESFNIRSEIVLIDNFTTLVNGEVDLLICQPHFENLPLTVIESYPTIKTNLALVYKPSKLNLTKDIFILTFAGSLWVVFFAIMILLALCLRISTRRYSAMRPNYESWTWVEITLWAIAAACQQGLSHTPSGFASCLIFFCGYLMAYLLYTGFAAAITSILVENVGKNSDLVHVKLENLHLISLKSTQHYIQQYKERFLVTEYVDNLNVLFDNLNVDNRIGIGPEIFIQQHMVNNFDREQILSFQIMKLNIKYTKGFLVLRTNPWRPVINRHILALEESGILQNKFGRNVRPVPTLDLNSGYSSAGQEHVGSAVLLFLGGVVVSLLFLVAEFVLYFYKRGRNHTGHK